MHARQPTDHELATIQPFHLTSSSPWNPALEDDDYDMADDSTDQPFIHEDLPVDGGVATMSNTKTKQQEPDWERIQQCLGYKPIDLCKKTMDATTQYARGHVELPMRDHYRSRYPALNCKRLNEIFATDTFFSSEKALGGFTCAQIFVGKSSYLTEVFGMQKESSMSDTLNDFIRKWGAPYALLSDNAKSELSNAVKEILRKYNIKDLQTEPHHPNQNPAERRIQEIKKTANTVMDRSGAPGCLWYLATVYAAYLRNRITRTRLGYKTPIEASIGETPDISALLHFHFYQPVFYYEKHNSPFPKSKERLGWWVGVAENTGDALCYKILTTDNEVIHRSVCRPSDNPLHPFVLADPHANLDADGYLMVCRLICGESHCQ